MLYVFSLYVSLLLPQNSIANSMNKDFCHAIIENDREILKDLINAQLDKLDSLKSSNENFEYFKIWLEKHDCISSVEIVQGVLRSEPTIKEFILTLENDLNNNRIRSIGIQLFPDKLRFSYK